MENFTCEIEVKRNGKTPLTFLQKELGNDGKVYPRTAQNIEIRGEGIIKTCDVFFGRIGDEKEDCNKITFISSLFLPKQLSDINNSLTELTKFDFCFVEVGPSEELLSDDKIFLIFTPQIEMEKLPSEK